MALIFHLWDKLWATVFPPPWTHDKAVIFHPPTCEHGQADD